MASSSSSSSSTGERFCFCNLKAVIHTCDRQWQYERRYWGCPELGMYDVHKPDNKGGCDFFAWFDPPYDTRAYEVIMELWKERKQLIKQNEGLCRESKSHRIYGTGQINRNHHSACEGIELPPHSILTVQLALRLCCRSALTTINLNYPPFQLLLISFLFPRTFTAYLLAITAQAPPQASALFIQVFDLLPERRNSLQISEVAPWVRLIGFLFKSCIMGSIGRIDDSFLIEGYSEANNLFKFNQDSPPSVLNHQDSSGGITSSDSCDVYDLINSPDTIPSYDSNHISIAKPASSYDSSELSPGVGDSLDVPDFSDACLKFLTDILMEENLDDKPATLQDYMALQATEKSLYDAIGESYSLPSDQIPPFLVPNVEIPDDDFTRAGLSTSVTTAESSQVLQTQFDPSLPQDTTSPSSSSASGADDVTVGLDTSAFSGLLSEENTRSNFDWIQKALSGITDLSNPEGYRSSSSAISSVSQSRRGRKIHQRDDNDNGEDGRSNKHTAYVEDEVQMEQYDDILLSCKGGPPCWDNKESSSAKDKTTRVQPSVKVKGSKGKKSRGKKQSNNEDVLDFSPLLTQCAQAVATFDLKGANELLKRLRQHSSPYGDDTQRAAHYFADGLEARLAGSASQLYSDFINWQISASSFLKAYRFYVKAVPFKRTSFFLANKTILKLSLNATRVHIIDFGIFCGIQWPCFIQALSNRDNGPPVLRITAVDFPERGYQPAARIEEAGRRLAGYCKRFGVPFEYQPIAQMWDTLQPEDFRLESDELLVVNCLYKGRALLDDTVEVDSPRDAFLKLIRKLKPDLFIHGIVNGTYNAPFFTTRFREALFHYSTIFDIFEATMPREGEERQLIERGLYGREILNVVACEGTDRVERPETYKQWQVRNQRAGLRQVPLDREIVSNAKAMVRANYHKDFVVHEVNNWMLQGWKGRLLYAISCWKPAN